MDAFADVSSAVFTPRKHLSPTDNIHINAIHQWLTSSVDYIPHKLRFFKILLLLFSGGGGFGGKEGQLISFELAIILA